ncbi:strawberry notch C-terminal domain-containing protein [Prevotella sp.]|uniref:strawberry notch C-terminal domain-containing protein n=1 Tax=Prevotella sp. TaxID=59823 RepID=UPI0030809B41
MVFVKDNKGRVLIVGAGDVAFDGEGRVRDGDMLTVYDPATREMNFVHAKDVTLERTTSSEEYAKDYQRQLEELNSTVYAEMQSGGEEGQPSLTEPAEPTEPVGEKETTPVGEEPVATFADGTPVPMMKDSKDRETADYSQMTAEQGAEWIEKTFGEDAEAVADGKIERAKKALSKAEKMKIDMSADDADVLEAKAKKKTAIETAKNELELYTNIKKAMTEKKVKAGMEKVSSVGGVGSVGEVGNVGVAREKFESGLRVVGNKRTRTLADGTKLKGHYEIVEADSLTPSHNANDGYKKSEGFPVNEEGRTINDRDYENDKQAQLVTDMIAMKYDGQAVDQVPVVTSDGIVVDGNGRTMAGQKAAKDGTDGAYLEALKENAENYGFTAEQIEQSGIKHPRLVLVSDEPMKYNTATLAKFNKNEKKAQGNTQQAVANSKKLSTDEIGAIVSEIEGSGSLDAFFNNPSAINSLLTRLVDKGVIGLNEVAGLREGENKLSASGKDFVKNLLLGSVFSENTIRMMGADAMLKTKALNGIRAVTDNMKLGDYALMKEIDQAVQLLYEARQGGSGVDAYLRTPAMFGENAADRFDPISQAIALALEGKAEDFRELMMAYNRNAAPYADASQTEMFGERPTKEDFVNEFLKLRNWEDYETRHSSKEGNGDAGSSEGTEPETSGGNEPTEGEGLAKSGDKTLERKNLDDVSTEENGRALEGDKEGKPENDNGGSHDRDIQAGEEQREVDKTQRTNTIRDPLVETTKAAFEQSKAEYLKALKEGKTGKELENAELHYKFSFLDYQNVMGVTDAESLEKLWKREFESAKTSETEPSEASLSLSKPLTDEEVVSITDAMKANAVIAPTVEINDANWKESVDTPIGTVKMGENQKAKLFAKGREQQYGMLLETLSNPNVVLEEKDKEQNMFHERPSSYLFVKTFQKEDGSKFVHFESVTVSQDGMEVSISSHIIRENQLKNKLKSDRLLYKATALDAPANTSAEQPIVGGSLSSDGKDKEKVSSEQGKEEKSVGGDKPSEASLSLSEPKDEEPLPILPKKEENTLNPIVKAAENYKKDHPLTEGEIRSSDVDDIAKDMAVDYLNGEVTDDLHRAVYESIYGKVKDAKMKNAAEKFAKEKEAATEAMGEENKPQQKADDAAVEASNKKVNDLWNDLLKAGREDLSASFIGLNARQLEVLPKLVSAMAENAYLRIKRGMHNLEDVVKEMRKEFAPAAKVFKKEDVDAIYEQMMNIRYRDGEQRMSLKEWADYYEKSSPKHKEELVGDSKTAEERKQAEKKFIDAVKLQLAFGRKIKSIIELRKIAERHGLKDIKDTDLQELAEVAIVMKARGIASSESTNDAVKFEHIKKLYENQPSLNQRDSERVMKQQYSTPAPYAFLADMYVKAGMEVKSALEPSAGNGMLTIGLPKDAVHVNDIDAQRLANLQRQGFKNITSQDGTQPFADKDVDVVVTNPPFGSATPRDYDGYTISSLEGQMAINALESMKDNGRAAIIIGGKTEYAKNGSLTPKDKALLGYLYSHYNVEDVINVDGSLYAKQGTTYPTRIILINGRRFDENAYPPVKDKARAEAVKSYDELYTRINDDILRSKGMDSPVGEGGEDANAKPNRPSVANTNEEGVRAGGSRESEQKPSVRTGGVHDKTAEPVSDNVLGTEGGTKPGENGGLPDGTTGANGAGADVTQSEGAGNNPNPEGGNVQKSGGNGRPNTQPNADGSAVGYRVGQQRLVNETPKRDLDTEKVSYVAQSSNPFSLHSVVPADQAVYTKKALERIGDVDQFLVDELGYNDKDDMYKALASEQADSVALAIHQAKQGKAFIIGDMTGIGKGRQAAAMIRFAYKQGNIPVFITAKKDLFSDIYRDLKSIGNSELRPFIWAADDKVHSADMTDKDGNIVFKRTSDKEQKRVMEYLMKNGKLPEEYDYIVTTYDSFNSGTIEYENGNKKARKDGKGSKNGQLKRNVLEHIALNANVIMDESHKAGGQGGGSAYLQYVVPKLNAVTFLSATYAKRPDNMPIYALRTSMNQAGMESSELIDAIKRGGATLQEIMSQALASSGQFIRRERDMTGVTIDWKAIDDPEVVAEQREQYDSIIGLFNDIINFQRTYVSAYVDRRNEELAEVQSSMGIKRGTEALGIKNQPFASKTYNMVQQVLLSLKAREAAKSGIEHLKNGEKIVIALNNTNESQTGQFGIGEEIDAPDLGVSLKKGLEGTLRYTSKNAKDESESGYINLSDLGADAVEAYHALEEKIGKTSTGLSLSPIDVIRDTLENAGYSVGEMTGRQYMFVKNPNGTVSKIKRTNTDKKKLALDFNTNNIDALILNRSASTGISLHDSVEYDVEHKPRTMIVVQQQADVNEEVQMRGRIDRTGQVNRGKYEYIVSQIPSEQRLLMMFKAKLKSLDANTTSSQKSKFNDMEVSDIINKYGDKVVKEYMAEHLDLYARMADPFGWEKAYGADLSTVDPQKLVASSDGMSSEAGGDASKLLGRMALLKVKEQEKMLQEIGDLYAAEIQRLNEMGENDLEITELPLKAKTINKGIWKEGSEPGGDNAFADNTYVEKVNMAVLKKPMKAEEVKKAQDGLTGNRSWDEYRKEKITAAKEYFDNKIAEATEKYEERAVKTATKAKEKYIKDAKKAQKDTGMSDEQIEKMAGYQYDSVYGDEKTKLDEVVKNLKSKYGVFERALETFNTDDAFVLPTDMNNPAELSGFGNSYGRLIDIKITDNFSPNASTVSFATLDGRRKITLPINGKVGIGSDKADVIGIIDRLTRQASAMGDKHLRVLSMDASNWDKLTSNESRKDGYIITGNLLQALIDTKEQGLGGQLVKYTTDTGEVKTGILMSEKFEPKGLANDKPINSVAEKFELPSNKGGITEITSSDGDVKIEQGFDYMKMARNYTIRVPKSNKKGGKYFLDKELMKMVDGGNFETRGNTMLAEVKADKLKDVLDRLSELGVKVREESEVHYRTEHGDASLGLSKPLEGRIAETVEKVSKQTGGKVKMVNSVEEIGNEEVRRDIENGKQVTGWYDEAIVQSYI